MKKKNKQKDSELLLAQRVVQQLISPTPSIPHSTTTSGTGKDSHGSCISVYSDLHATLLQPLAHAPSLAPSFAPDKENDNPDLNLANLMNGIPREFALSFAALPGLPTPSRELRRVKPVPVLDMEHMSNKERIAYRSELKLNLGRIALGDKTIVLNVLSQFKSLVLTHSPFPTEEEVHWLAGHANLWACKKSGGVNLEIPPNSPYKELVSLINGIKCMTNLVSLGL